MSDQTDAEAVVHLEEVNAQLNKSLDKCRALLRECRTNLAANSNEPADDEHGEESQSN